MSCGQADRGSLLAAVAAIAVMARHSPPSHGDATLLPLPAPEPSCEAAAVTDDEIAQIARLLSQRNAIDDAIAAVIHRPMTAGHLGEWTAAQVFDIELEQSAVTAAIDGRFRSGPLQGRTVNVKWYLKQEGLLDMSESSALGYYLVLTGPRSAALTSRSSTRPWRIDHVYLFDSPALLAEQRTRSQNRGGRQRPKEPVERRRNLPCR
jgi:hypothetical protein